MPLNVQGIIPNNSDKNFYIIVVKLTDILREYNFRTEDVFP